MPVPRHLEDAANRMEAAALRIDRVKTLPLTPDVVREWLEALAAYAFALSDLQRYANESVHEKLHDLARHLRLPPGSWGSSPTHQGP